MEYFQVEKLWVQILLTQPKGWFELVCGTSLGFVGEVLEMSLSSQESVQTTYKFSLVSSAWIMETDNAVPKWKDTVSKLKTIRTELSLKNFKLLRSQSFFLS